MPDAETQPKTSLAGSSTVQDTRSLAEAFSLLSRYGDEYMDETPLVGEPGSFILSKSGDATTATAAAKTGPSNAPTRTGTPSAKADASFLSGRAAEKTSTPGPEGNKLKRKKSKP